MGESIPNIAKTIGIKITEVRKVLQHLQETGKIKRAYRVRATAIIRLTVKGRRLLRRNKLHMPSALRDSALTAKQKACIIVCTIYRSLLIQLLSKLAHCCKRTASTTIKQAEELGLIKILRTPGYQHRFQLLRLLLKARRGKQPIKEYTSFLPPVKKFLQAHPDQKRQPKKQFTPEEIKSNRQKLLTHAQHIRNFSRQPLLAQNTAAAPPKDFLFLCFSPRRRSRSQ